MLEKKKINIDVAGALGETLTIEDKNGNAVNILKMIPYAEKEQMIRELGETVLSGDEDAGICYINALFGVMLNYYFVKYYTDIDVSDLHELADYQGLYDYCMVNGLDYYTLCREDYICVMDYWETYQDSVARLFEKRCSLGYAVKALLNTEVDTKNQETKELIEKLIDLNEADKARKQSPIQLGNNVLNFARRKENN